MRLGGDAGDHHAFNDPVGIALHHRAVHERAGVAFIAVADDVLFWLRLAKHLFPFLSSWEAGASAPPQPGVGYLFYDFLRRHIKQGLGDGAVAADGDVFYDGLGVDMAAVLQGHPHLLLIKRNIVLPLVGDSVLIPVDQTVHYRIAQNALFNNFLAVLRLYLNIEPAHWFDSKERAHLAEAVAAALF